MKLLDRVLGRLIGREHGSTRKTERQHGRARRKPSGLGAPRQNAAVALDFLERGDAAFAKRGVVGAFANMRRIVPAALAFLRRRRA